MNDFDVGVVLWFNQFVGHQPAFDDLVVALTEMHVFRGAFFMSLICWAYFDKHRQIIEASLFWPRIVLGTILAVGVSRALQNFLPGRLRPRHEPVLEFVLPSRMQMAELQDWSSFPSDHGVFFGALSVGLFLLDRRFGWLGIIWTVLFILWPRIYTGAHYPSDLIAGTLIGGVIMITVWRLPTSWFPQKALLNLNARHNGLLTAGLVMFFYLSSTMFDDVRLVVNHLPDFFDMLVAGRTEGQ